MKLTLFLLFVFLVAPLAAAPTPSNPTPSALPQPGTSPSPLIVDPDKPIKVLVVSDPAQRPGLDPWWKDWVDAASKVVSMIGIVFTFISIVIAAALAYNQFVNTRELRAREVQERTDRTSQRQEELAWKKEEAQRKDDEVRREKANLARAILTELSQNTYANDAMNMLDWDQREYDVRITPGAGATAQNITERDVWAGLRFAERHFVPKERYIRDCFDRFFGIMERLEDYIGKELIKEQDVRDPFAYFAQLMKDDGRWIYEYFINEYHPKAARFLERFPEWTSCVECAGKVSSPAGENEPCQTCAGSGLYSIPYADKAFFMFDCPPRTERFVLAVEDRTKVQMVRDEILTSQSDRHVTGKIVDGETYYNSPWPFHIAPASIDFVAADLDFADQVNVRIEANLSPAEKATFAHHDVWHYGGARLLTELPADRFESDQVWTQNLETLKQQGRVA